MADRKETELKYSTDIYVKKILKDELLEKYLNIEALGDACKLCPSCGKVWSCPAELPNLAECFKEQNALYVVAVKVNYPEQLRKETDTPEKTQEVRKHTYERVKKDLLLTLLEIEKYIPGGRCAGAGQCILCERCACADNQPCRYPELCRYSFTRFGLDCTAMLKDLFNIQLVWNKEGLLPEYDVVKAAMFVRE